MNYTSPNSSSQEMHIQFLIWGSKQLCCILNASQRLIHDVDQSIFHLHWYTPGITLLRCSNLQQGSALTVFEQYLSPSQHFSLPSRCDRSTVLQEPVYPPCQLGVQPAARCSHWEVFHDLRTGWSWLALCSFKAANWLS